MSYRIALVGGGTGGHVYPLIAVAKELEKQAPSQGVELELQMFGDGSFAKLAAEKAGIKYINILSAKWRRYFSIYNFIDLLKIPIGIFQSVFYMWLFMPDIVFAKGGYASVIPLFAAKIFMIPIVVHESDAIPGKANLILARIAQKIFISFEKSREYFPVNKTELTGNPTREEIVSSVPKDKALELFQLSKDKPLLFVIGGSQGAQLINQIILKSVVELIKDFQIIHQCGVKNFNFVQAEINKIIKEGRGSYSELIKNSYRLYPFLNADQLALAYSATDIILTRAGSGSLFEIAAIRKPAIVVPIADSASDHQLENAREFTKYGGILIEESNLTRHILISQIKEVYKNRQELSLKISQFAKPNAASFIAKELLITPS